MEEKIKTVVGILAIIGIFTVLSFVSSLFSNNNDDNSYICSDFENKTETLEGKIVDLKEEIISLENENKELKSNLEVCKEELNLCSKDSEKYKNYEWPKLTDGANS